MFKNKVHALQNPMVISMVKDPMVKPLFSMVISMVKDPMVKPLFSMVISMVKDPMEFSNFQFTSAFSRVQEKAEYKSLAECQSIPVVSNSTRIISTTLFKNTPLQNLIDTLNKSVDYPTLTQNLSIILCNKIRSLCCLINTFIKYVY